MREWFSSLAGRTDKAGVHDNPHVVRLGTMDFSLSGGVVSSCDGIVKTLRCIDRRCREQATDWGLGVAVSPGPCSWAAPHAAPAAVPLRWHSSSLHRSMSSRPARRRFLESLRALRFRGADLSSDLQLHSQPGGLATQARHQPLASTNWSRMTAQVPDPAFLDV